MTVPLQGMHYEKGTKKDRVVPEIRNMLALILWKYCRLTVVRPATGKVTSELASAGKSLRTQTIPLFESCVLACNMQHSQFAEWLRHEYT